MKCSNDRNNENLSGLNLKRMENVGEFPILTILSFLGFVGNKGDKIFDNI